MAKKLKPVPSGNKGLPKLPKDVRNDMGFLMKVAALKLMALCKSITSNLRQLLLKAQRMLGNHAVEVQQLVALHLEE